MALLVRDNGGGSGSGSGRGVGPRKEAVNEQTNKQTNERVAGKREGNEKPARSLSGCPYYFTGCLIRQIAPVFKRIFSSS
jgi:hypothetical protein